MLVGTRPAHADLLTPEEEKWVRECIARLDANAPRVRKSAERALIDMGRVALPAIVANLKRVDGPTAEKGLVRVLMGYGRGPVLQDLTRLHEAARSGERKRLEALMTLLGEALGTGEPLAIELEERAFTEWRSVPPSAEHALSGGWPERLLPGGGAVTTKGDVLELTREGTTTRFKRGVPQVVLLKRPGATQPMPVLIYDKLGRWYAASASVRHGGVRGLKLHVWDTDLDGRFDGPGDLARLDPGRWQQARPGRLTHGDRVVSLLLKPDASGALGAALTVQANPRLLDPGHRTALARLNRWRAAHGLGPLTYDAKRSRACMEHTQYLALNNDRREVVDGGGAHQQLPELPGATAAGAEAGGSSVLIDAGLRQVVHQMAATMLHRIAWLAPPSTPVGIGESRQGRAHWSAVWTDRQLRDIPLVVVPAPGATDAPTRGSSEWPPPDKPPAWYEGKRGYPISATYAHLGLTKPRLEVLQVHGDATSPVSGEVWSPEKPIAASHGANRGTIFFMPMAPLARGATFWAVFEAQGPSGPVRYAWTFTTP